MGGTGETRPGSGWRLLRAQGLAEGRDGGACLATDERTHLECRAP